MTENTINFGDPHEYLNGKHLKDWSDKVKPILESMSIEELLEAQNCFSELSELARTYGKSKSNVGSL